MRSDDQISGSAPNSDYSAAQGPMEIGLTIYIFDEAGCCCEEEFNSLWQVHPVEIVRKNTEVTLMCLTVVWACPVPYVRAACRAIYFRTTQGGYSNGIHGAGLWLRMCFSLITRIFAAELQTKRGVVWIVPVVGKDDEPVRKLRKCRS